MPIVVQGQVGVSVGDHVVYVSRSSQRGGRSLAPSQLVEKSGQAGFDAQYPLTLTMIRADAKLLSVVENDGEVAETAVNIILRNYNETKQRQQALEQEVIDKNAAAAMRRAEARGKRAAAIMTGLPAAPNLPSPSAAPRGALVASPARAPSIGSVERVTAAGPPSGAIPAMLLVHIGGGPQQIQPEVAATPARASLKRATDVEDRSTESHKQARTQEV